MNVTVYFTQICPWCAKVKDFLKSHNIKFKGIDVGENANAAREMIEKSGQQGVPVIDVDGKIIIGYDEPKLRKIFKING